MKWVYLVIAIVSEVIATSALKESEGFTQAVPLTISILGYGISLFFLSLTLKEMPVGVAYAIWSGFGVFLITLVSYFRFNQKLDLPAFLGIGLIVAGVLVINLMSESVTN